jgi:hypothetical protein
MADTSSVPSKLWKPAAIGSALLALANMAQPAYDIYSKAVNPDDWGRVKSMEFARQQQKLQQRNLTCSLNMSRSLVRSGDVTLQYGVCPNNDVLIAVYPDNKPAYQQWLTPENFVESASVADLIGKAYAAMPPVSRPKQNSSSATLPVQIQLKTVCQDWQDKTKQTKIVRITNEGGQCFRELINVVSGRVEIREKVTCDTKCQPAANADQR